MQLYIDFWNEEEVKLKFIGNLISLKANRQQIREIWGE
jgi:hypothetical protein